ncbi:hypothetical protein RQP46_010247 [Phenoliferia psychrophenolica]
MATIDSLAPELLDDILEHLLTEWEQPDLYAASIVCRRWQDPAQRVLFQNVVLPNKSMANAWLQSPARPRYRARSLAMGHWGDSPLSMEILAACPDLRSLCLDYKSEDGGYEWCSSAHVEAHAPLMGTIEDSVAAVGVAVVPTLQNLILTGIWMKENTIEELLSILKLPNLVGIRRLEIPKVQKDNLAGEAGLALLDECEERSISLLCRYGWLTRDMMKVASPARD